MKPSSVLISENGLLKLDVIDISVQLEDDGSKRQRVDDSSLLIAPEVVANTPCLKSDVWSLGMSVIEMVEGKHPYSSYKVMRIIREVLNEKPPTLSPSECSCTLVDFVNRCLVREPTNRASVRELLEVGIGKQTSRLASLRKGIRRKDTEQRILAVSVESCAADSQCRACNVDMPLCNPFHFSSCRDVCSIHGP